MAGVLTPLVSRLIALLMAAEGESEFSTLDAEARDLIFFVARSQNEASKLLISSIAGTRRYGSYPTAQKRLSALVDAGWLEYADDPNDGRVKIVRLSAKAVDALIALSGRIEELIPRT